MTLKLSSGEVVFYEGDKQHTMYNIIEGEIAIVIDYGKSSEKQLVKLTSGQFFGEMSLLQDEPRSATAIAMTDVVLEVVDEESFNAYIQSNPEFAKKMLKYFTSRLRAITSDYQEACRTIAKVYDLNEVKGAVEKADQLEDEKAGEKTINDTEDDSAKKKGFLARSIEKIIDAYNSDAYQNAFKYRMYYHF